MNSIVREPVQAQETAHSKNLKDIDTIPFDPIPSEFAPWMDRNEEWDKNWQDSADEYQEAPWKHYQPLCAARGYKLFLPSEGAGPGAPSLLSAHDPGLAARMRTYSRGYLLPPARDAFNPQENEALCYALGGPRPAGRFFKPDRPNICGAYDRRSRAVVIKALPTDSNELRVLLLLHAPHLRSDPHNRTLPVLDWFRTGNAVFIVMPEWARASAHPSPLNVKEYLREIIQHLEGLLFMHRNLIAHRDLHTTNILSNHITFLSRAYIEPAPFRSNFDSQVGFIDFEIAATFFPGDDLCICHAPEESRSNAPETVSGKPYNPFLSDVFSLGEHFLEELDTTHEIWHRGYGLPLSVRDVLQNVAPSFLDILAGMKKEDPKERTTLKEALTCCNALLQNLSDADLHLPYRAQTNTRE